MDTIRAPVGAIAALFTLLAAGALTSACGPRERAPAADSTSTAGIAGGGTGIQVPPGSKATVLADNIGSARHAVVAPNGDVYINTWRSPYDTSRQAPAGGYVVALRDTNRDGHADVIQRFGATSESGSRGGTGIALRDNELYVETDSTILRHHLTPGQLVPTGKPDTIVRGLQTVGGHPMHPLAVDGKGNLFVNVGSDTNSCQEKDRQVESKGVDPCKELETRAGIWRFSATRTGQRFTPAARYATGIRNANLAIDPGTGALYATQHGRDQLGQNWPKLYDWKQSANLPAEVLLKVDQGADFGWPYCYYDPEQRRLVLAPEYGGDGKKVGRCATKRAPVAVFPAHWAPNAVVFLPDSGVAEAYRNGAFIAFHGSWNRAPEPQEGYKVVFQPLAEGRPAGEFQVFADGFAGKQMEPGLADHRPAGLALAPNGSLVITDDQRGRVWIVAPPNSAS
jgi:glucose/arabinose dehydrogenase